MFSTRRRDSRKKGIAQCSISKYIGPWVDSATCSLSSSSTMPPSKFTGAEFRSDCLSCRLVQKRKGGGASDDDGDDGGDDDDDDDVGDRHVGPMPPFIRSGPHPE